MAEKTKPLTNNLKWDEYFMGLAKLSAMRSKDPSTQVGACIVDDNHKVVSIGYNGMPRGVCDDEIPWGHGEGLDSKYLYVCHAEFNAILNTRDGSALNGCTIYVTLFPCNECAKAIVQVGIKEIIFADDKYHDHLEEQASRRILDMAGVKYRRYEGRNVEIIIALCYGLAGIAIFVPLLNDKNRTDWVLWTLLGVLIAGFIATVLIAEIVWHKKRKESQKEEEHE